MLCGKYNVNVMHDFNISGVLRDIMKLASIVSSLTGSNDEEAVMDLLKYKAENDRERAFILVPQSKS